MQDKIHALTQGDESNEGDVHLYFMGQDGPIGRLDDALASLAGFQDEPDVMRAVAAGLRRHADRIEREAREFEATRKRPK